MPQEYANFPLAKNVRLALAPTLINKDVFEPSKNDFFRSEPAIPSALNQAAHRCQSQAKDNKTTRQNVQRL